MDSEHRHELQENDLAVAITSIKDWWAKHQMKVLGGAVLAAALILAIRWMNASSTETRNTEQYQLAMSTTPDAFRALAQATGNESVQVQANLRGADAILPQIRKSVGTGPDQVTADARKQLLDKADMMYKAALDGAAHPLVKIKAHLGLAAVAETRGDWAKAKTHYETVQKIGSGGYEFLTERAAKFAEALPRIQTEPVYGREIPKKTEFNLLNPTGTTPEKDKGKDDEKDATPTKGLLFPAAPELIPDADKAKDKEKSDAEKDGTPGLPLIPAPVAPEKDAK